jgi:anti-sigma-K factor RskA
MKLDSPVVVDHLAAHYALGQLSPSVRRRFEAYASGRADLRAAIAIWEAHVHSLARSIPDSKPSPALWTRIETKLFGEQTNTQSMPTTSPWWCAITTFFSGQVTPLKLGMTGAIGAILAVLALNLLLPQPKSDDIAALKRDALPQSYVGLLLDSKDTATLLASSLRNGKTLTVKMLKPLPKDANLQYRLWAMPSDGAPFSLGLVPQSGNATISMPDTSEKLLSKVQRLVVFSEPIGTNHPTPNGTPVLSGHCVKLW